MSKIVFLNGSNRKNGNLQTIFQKIVEGADANNVEIKTFNLAKLNISACKGCFHCRQHDHCIISDDMSKVLDEIINADYVVIGSPIYFFQISGQTKLMIDRLYPLMSGEPRNYGLRHGQKKTITIYTQGAPSESAFQDYISHNHKGLELLGLNIVDTLICTNANDQMSAAQNADILEKAFEIGRKLI